MSQKRLRINGRIYFITTRTFENSLVFANPECCEILLSNIKYYQKRLKFKLLAYCILPDHVHILLWPSVKYDISKIMQLIKYRTASDIRKFKISRRNKGCHCSSGEPGSPLQEFDGFNTIWQRSFYDRMIRSDRQLYNTLNYIEYNSVKHGLVDDPIKYLYSSYHNRYKTGQELINTIIL